MIEKGDNGSELPALLRKMLIEQADDLKRILPILKMQAMEPCRCQIPPFLSFCRSRRSAYLWNQQENSKGLFWKAWQETGRSSREYPQLTIPWNSTSMQGNRIRPVLNEHRPFHVHPPAFRSYLNTHLTCAKISKSATQEN